MQPFLCFFSNMWNFERKIVTGLTPWFPCYMIPLLQTTACMDDFEASFPWVCLTSDWPYLFE